MFFYFMKAKLTWRQYVHKWTSRSKMATRVLTETKGKSWHCYYFCNKALSNYHRDTLTSTTHIHKLSNKRSTLIWNSAFRICCENSLILWYKFTIHCSSANTVVAPNRHIEIQKMIRNSKCSCRKLIGTWAIFTASITNLKFCRILIIENLRSLF